LDFKRPITHAVKWAAQMRRALRHTLKLAAGISVTVFFLWLLLRNLDLGALKSAFFNLDSRFILLALAFLATGYYVRIARWWWMLRVLEPGLRFSTCVWPFITSIAVNNVLPLRAGDALRIFGFRTQLRSPAMRIAGTLVVERLFDLLALLTFFFIGLMGLPPGTFPATFVKLAAWLAGSSVTLLFVFILFSQKFAELLQWITHRPILIQRGWSDKVQLLGTHFIESLTILRSPLRVLVLFCFSVATWACEGAVFATVAHALGSGAGAIAPWFSLATGTLATLLPSSPGYVGTFDYFAMQGLVAYGASSETAAAFALTVHAVLWLPLTAAGLLYLLSRGQRTLLKRAPQAKV